MKLEEPNRKSKLSVKGTLSLAIAALAVVGIAKSGSTEPFRLGAEANTYIESGGGQYPAPQMVQTPGLQTQQAVRANPSNPLRNFEGNPLQGGASTAIKLPESFLGTWKVTGQRQKVEAMPEFQAGAEQAFSTGTRNIWKITGQAGNYNLGSDTGVQTAIFVDKVSGSTAFLRYQHPIKNTMAQEAIVLSLQGGGNQFGGLERVSIVKEGLAQPRAKVTYQLVGTKQR